MVAPPAVNYHIIASTDRVPGDAISPELIVAELATVGNTNHSTLQTDNHTDNEDNASWRKDVHHCDNQQEDILQVFDYNKQAYHSYWVYANYTHVMDLALLSTIIAALVVGCMPGIFVWFRILGWTVFFISCALMVTRLHHVLLLQMIRDSKVAPYTAMTRSGIKHLQPPSRKSPDGGELFIPFHLVQNVDVYVIQNILGDYRVSEVHVCIHKDLREASVKGIPTFRSDYYGSSQHLPVNLRPLPRQSKILCIKGLCDPYEFQRLVMANAPEGAANQFQAMLDEAFQKLLNPQSATTTAKEQTVLELRDEMRRHNELLERFLAHVPSVKGEDVFSAP